MADDAEEKGHTLGSLLDGGEDAEAALSDHEEPAPADKPSSRAPRTQGLSYAARNSVAAPTPTPPGTAYPCTVCQQLGHLGSMCPKTAEERKERDARVIEERKRRGGDPVLPSSEPPSEKAARPPSPGRPTIAPRAPAAERSALPHRSQDTRAPDATPQEWTLQPTSAPRVLPSKDERPADARPRVWTLQPESRPRERRRSRSRSPPRKERSADRDRDRKGGEDRFRRQAPASAHHSPAVQQPPPPRPPPPPAAAAASPPEERRPAPARSASPPPLLDSILGEARRLKHAADEASGQARPLLMCRAVLQFLRGAQLQETSARALSGANAADATEAAAALARLFGQTGALADFGAAAAGDLLKPGGERVATPLLRALSLARLLCLRLSIVCAARSFTWRRGALRELAVPLAAASGAGAETDATTLQRLSRSTLDAVKMVDAWERATALSLEAAALGGLRLESALTVLLQVTVTGGVGELAPILVQAEAAAEIVQSYAADAA